MKKNLFLSVSLIALFTLSLIPKSLYAQVTVDENKNVLVGSGSPTSGYKFTVNGHTDILGTNRSNEFLTQNLFGSISMRQRSLSNPTLYFQELHIRPLAVISFTTIQNPKELCPTVISFTTIQNPKALFEVSLAMQGQVQLQTNICITAHPYHILPRCPKFHHHPKPQEAVP